MPEIKKVTRHWKYGGEGKKAPRLAYSHYLMIMMLSNPAADFLIAEID
jgi:hypothetical protein